MVAKNGEFFSQPILGRDRFWNCTQRWRLAAGLASVIRPPSYLTRFKNWTCI